MTNAESLLVVLVEGERDIQATPTRSASENLTRKTWSPPQIIEAVSAARAEKTFSSTALQENHYTSSVNVRS